MCDYGLVSGMTSPSPSPLTVADLIEHLKTLPPSAPVVMLVDGGAATATIRKFCGLSEYGHFFDINESEYLTYTN